MSANTTRQPPVAGGSPVVLKTERGDIECVYHPVAGAQAAVIWVGGTDGGLNGPADGIYPLLAADLMEHGIASLRLNYRVLGAPGNLREAAHDVLAGIDFLSQRGVRRIGLVGHSFGGAVVITAAALSRDVAAVVALSSQTAGTELTPQVAPRPLLLVHGQDDRRLPPWCSQDIYARAGQPKELVLLAGARHSLRQKKVELRALLRRWLAEKLAPSP